MPLFFARFCKFIPFFLAGRWFYLHHVKMFPHMFVYTVCHCSCLTLIINKITKLGHSCFHSRPFHGYLLFLSLLFHFLNCKNFPKLNLHVSHSVINNANSNSISLDSSKGIIQHYFLSIRWTHQEKPNEKKCSFFWKR